MKSNWEKVGTIYVDAGIVMMGDPCYTLPDDASHRDEVAKDWRKFCKKLDHEENISFPISFPFGPGTSIVVSSGYGDGEYDVEVKRKDGRIKELRVVFF